MPAWAKDPAVSDDAGLREFVERTDKALSFLFSQDTYICLCFPGLAVGKQEGSMGRVAILSPSDPSLHPPLTSSQRRTACLVNISSMVKESCPCLLNIPFSSYPSAPLTPSLSKGKDW